MGKTKIAAVYCLMGIAFVLGMASCSSGTSYAELLRDERKATNKFLAYHRVETQIPADTIFEEGENAPYYKLDDDGNVYMQVIKAGSLANRPKANQKVYFRFMFYSLFEWEPGTTPEMVGNANDTQMGSTYFIYGNYNLQQSYKWGYGLQMPLKFVGFDSEVNLVIKSQYGFSDEISNVIPYHFNVRYFESVMD